MHPTPMIQALTYGESWNSFKEPTRREPGLLARLFARKPREPKCQECSGSGKEHVCGMGACVDLDTACPSCGGTGHPRKAPELSLEILALYATRNPIADLY